MPAVPANLQVPGGNRAYLKAHAEGTQNYVCLPTATGFAWTFVAPQATLSVKIKWFPRDVEQHVTTHFLSPNLDEGGTPRPTWQSSFDTSAVWGRALQSSVDPQFVAAGAIQWLLVQAVGTERWPNGGGTQPSTTFIQRVNTPGGFAPATTDYVFYRASGRN